MHPPTIVCAVDYSDCSRRALRYAGALAAHFGARLLVVHVVDPLLLGAAAIQQMDLTGAEGREELSEFVSANLHLAAEGREPEFVLKIGSPAAEVLEVAEEHAADLIVIGSHGYTGAKRAFFGSTARQVLRRARVPVLAVPLTGSRESEVTAPLISSGRVIAPVDFSLESEAAARAAAGLARALDLPLLLLHIAADVNAAARVNAQLFDLAASLDHHLAIDAWILIGEPGDEIARVARDEKASVVVMSLASAPRQPGQPPGSVAYRVLSHAPSPILALPATEAGSIFVSHLRRSRTAIAV